MLRQTVLGTSALVSAGLALSRLTTLVVMGIAAHRLALPELAEFLVALTVVNAVMGFAGGAVGDAVALAVVAVPRRGRAVVRVGALAVAMVGLLVVGSLLLDPAEAYLSAGAAALALATTQLVGAAQRQQPLRASLTAHWSTSAARLLAVLLAAPQAESVLRLTAVLCGAAALACMGWKARRKATLGSPLPPASSGRRVLLGGLVVASTYFLLQQVDVLALALLSEAEELVLYTPLMRYMEAASLGTTVLILLSGRALAGRDLAAARLLRRQALAAHLLLSAVLIALAPVVQPLITGEEAPVDATVLLCLVTAYALGTQLAFALQLAVAGGALALLCRSAAVALCADALVLALLVPLYGATGAALGNLVGYGVMTVLLLPVLRADTRTAP